MKPEPISIPISLNVEDLARLRLLLSQIGFALDNYLAGVPDTPPETT